MIPVRFIERIILKKVLTFVRRQIYSDNISTQISNDCELTLYRTVKESWKQTTPLSISSVVFHVASPLTLKGQRLPISYRVCIVYVHSRTVSVMVVELLTRGKLLDRTTTVDTVICSSTTTGQSPVSRVSPTGGKSPGLSIAFK